MEELVIIKCCKLETICFSGNNISKDQSALKLNKWLSTMASMGARKAERGMPSTPFLYINHLFIMHFAIDRVLFFKEAPRPAWSPMQGLTS